MGHKGSMNIIESQNLPVGYKSIEYTIQILLVQFYFIHSVGPKQIIRNTEGQILAGLYCFIVTSSDVVEEPE